MTDKLDEVRELLGELIHDRATSADIPWHTTVLIDRVEQFLNEERVESDGSVDSKEPKISDRGFKRFDPIPAWPVSYSGTVRVYESSAAVRPCIWVATDGNDHIHLTVEDAAELRDQLSYLIEHHYQIEGDSDG